MATYIVLVIIGGVLGKRKEKIMDAEAGTLG